MSHDTLSLMHLLQVRDVIVKTSATQHWQNQDHYQYVLVDVYWVDEQVIITTQLMSDITE